jgi:dolichol-phosphate mannosyltransferase
MPTKNLQQNTSPIKLSILVCLRNKGSNVKVMLKVLHAMIEVSHEILFIHDNPDDACVELVNILKSRDPNTRLIRNQLGLGFVDALKSGVEASRGEYILIFAGDEAGPVLAIEDMINLMDQNCDLVSCTRYAHGGRRLGGSRIGHILSWSANKLFFYFFGSALTDCTTGIKMFRKSLFNEFDFKSNSVGWSIAFELSIKVQLLGLKVGEVPIVSINRLFGGAPNFQLRPWCIEYLRWIVWGLRNFRLLRKNKNKTALVRLPYYCRVSNLKNN